MSAPALLPYATVRLEGTELSPELSALLVQLRVRDSLRLPDQAVLRLADPQLTHVDKDVIAVGQQLEIDYAAPGSTTARTVFSGVVQSIELELVGAGAFIAATAYEPAFALHRNRRTQVFQNMTAGDMAQAVISRAGLTPSIATSSVPSSPYEFMLQSDETDWQFLWRLASAADFEVVGEGKTVHFRPAGPTSAPAVALQAPEQLISFRPRISGIQQLDTVTVRGWDPVGAQAIVSSQAPSSPDSTPGIERSAVAAAAGGGAWAVGNHTVVSQDEADALAKSMAARMTNAWIEAEGIAAGDPKLGAGCTVDISGVGERFGGSYVVTSATHELLGGRGYQTHFTISGRSARTLLDLLDSARASPPVGTGLVVGVVTQTNDPDGLGRVRVRYPALGDDTEGWWARIASPSAGQARGVLMLPIAGDEVVVAFEHGDQRRPYVLGSVWNGQATPGTDLVKEDGSFALASDHDVTLTAAEAATVTANAKALTLKGQSVVGQAEAQFQVKGATVSIDSDGTITIKGQAITVQAEESLSISSSGTIQVSAALVSFG